MEKHEVEIGGTYSCKVSDKLTVVRIDRVSKYGGWDATNLTTKNAVRIKSAGRLRGKAGDRAAQGASVASGNAKATQDAKAKKGRDTAQQGAPEATPQADERACYVCHKPIKDGQAQAIGKGLCRHKGCDPVEPPAGEAPAGTKPKAKRASKTSLLDAAIQVLGTTGTPMNAKDMVEAVLDQKLWSTKGKTPHATLYASILREIQAKGDGARFVKTERGKFALHA